MTASTLSDLTIMTVSSAFGTSTTIPLGSAAVIGGVTFLSFSGAGTAGGTTVSYSILDPVNGGSEIGQSLYNSSNTTLTGRTPTKSTNGNAAITASSGALIYGAARGEDLNAFIVAGQLLGTATNDSASSGNVGEFVSTNVTSSVAVNLTSGQISNIATVGLTAGDWDLTGSGFFMPATATSITRWGFSMETSSNAFSQLAPQGWIESVAAVIPGVNPCGQALPVFRVSLGSSATYFLNTVAVFTASTLGAYGILRARRTR